jgi:hypothetical protein
MEKTLGYTVDSEKKKQYNCDQFPYGRSFAQNIFVKRNKSKRKIRTAMNHLRSPFDSPAIALPI